MMPSSMFRLKAELGQVGARYEQAMAVGHSELGVSVSCSPRGSRARSSTGHWYGLDSVSQFAGQVGQRVEVDFSTVRGI